MNIIEISNDFCFNYLSVIRRAASTINITQSQAFCLNAIPFDGIIQTDLAHKLSIDISTLSRNLNKLTNLNLIEKKSSPMDMRISKISLTSKGEKLYKKFIQLVTKELQTAYDDLDLSEKGHIEEILNKINWKLELYNKL